MNTAQTNPAHLQGEWTFTGYYPEDCKTRPDCHTFRMDLDLAKKEKSNYVFDTKSVMRGESCPLDAKSYSARGVTQVQGSRIRFGKEEANLGFSWLSNPFYIDQDSAKEKLFIKEKGKEGACWSTFEKFDEKAEKEEFRQKILYHLNKITEAQRNSLRYYRMGKFIP
jgi:hypothetical protein